MSIATASTRASCSALNVFQKPSRLAWRRPSATNNTRERLRSLTTVR